MVLKNRLNKLNDDNKDFFQLFRKLNMRKLSHCDNVIYSMSCLFSTVAFDFDNENTSSFVLS